MNNKVLIIIIVALVVIVGAVAGVFVMMNSGSSKEKEPEVVIQEFKLEELYTNIKDEGKILKVEMSVEYNNPELLKSFEKNKSKIVNNIYEYFRNQDYKTLSKPNGQERAREELKDIITEIMGVEGDTITNVYFTQFIIQG